MCFYRLWSNTTKLNCSILTWFLNNKKIPSISKIFHNGIIISNFKEKDNLFNSFFSFQFTPASDSCVLPTNSFHTSTTLNLLSITKDILSIIKLLDPNRWDNVSKIMQLYDESLTMPLKSIFILFLETRAVASTREGTHASKFTCAIYCTRNIIVF